VSVESGLFFDIIVIFAAAFLGGLIARVLHSPVILGYLVVGLLLGPHALQLVNDVETVRILAEFGVIFLLFAVGIEISFESIRQLGKVVILGGIIQVVATAGLAGLIGILWGWTASQSILLGLVVSLSSTMVVLKSLIDRGELHTLHGRILTGMLLIQDLAFIPMIAMLPALGGQSAAFLPDLGMGLLKAAVVLGLMALLGYKAIPWVLNYVARLGSREVFILAVVAITFATAGITHMAGLSAAMGAFVAGLLLSQSDFGHRAFAEIAPLKDTFSALFFVSLGMLIDPNFVMDNLLLVLGVVALAAFLKFTITAGILRSLGYLPHTALLTGVGLIQVGEFSFILADTATALGIVGQEFFSLAVVSAVLSMAVTPWAIAGASRATGLINRRFGWLRPYRLDDGKSDMRIPPLKGHVVICGLGRVGSLVARVLKEHHVSIIVIDLDPQVVSRCQQLGHYAIHGSSDSQPVLEAAQVKSARLMVISTGDPVSSLVTAQNALQLNPELDVVARVHWREEGDQFQQIGVKEVVWPEMEAGLEILRHSLNQYGVEPAEVDSLLGKFREHLNFG
jgi:CPA2 family monovalent cation:H+ antiporter-2